jgi:hypothetical protein
MLLKRILRYIKGISSVGICWRIGINCKGYVVLHFVDDLNKRKSITGCVFSLAGRTIS